MWKHLFQHVDINPGNVHILNGNAEDLQQECDDVRTIFFYLLAVVYNDMLKYEAAILAAGGIELFLGGIGPDGYLSKACLFLDLILGYRHIAFNEPGSSLISRTRVKTLVRIHMCQQISVWH